MKKKLIAIAVAAALAPAAAMADATVYGRVHLSLDDVSGIAANKNNLALNSNSSRFGEGQHRFGRWPEGDVPA